VRDLSGEVGLSATMPGRRVAWPDGILASGEYAQAPTGAWFAGTPSGHLANLSRHAITEHEDGTITVSPSIRVSSPAMDGGAERELWHGYLERGVWRSC
jgi:hypothetical protein